MFETPLSRQLGAVRAWQRSRVRLLRRLEPFLQQQGLASAATRRAFARASSSLRDGPLTIAIAGEHSRGKSALLNALFFADLGAGLLPTDAGRTTRCPIEIAHDRTRRAQLRLLPIETRAGARTLHELRDTPAAWHVVDIDPDNPEALAASLELLTHRQLVDCETAARLGLLGDTGNPPTPGLSIPRWRLAQLNLPHPLLDQGLRILDTPGLDAIGGETELTGEMLPAADVILFVLGADTGVTRSDLAIWQAITRAPGRRSHPGLAVVINKTDTLWDQRRTANQIGASIIRQCRSTARTLGVDESRVFALSAHRALLARVNGDHALERRSGIDGLERHLGRAVVGKRFVQVRRRYRHHVMQVTAALKATIDDRIARNAAQRRRLLDLANRSDAAIVRLLQAARTDYARYKADVEIYRHDLARFQHHVHHLLDAVDSARLEPTLQRVRARMAGAWTTTGLRNAMGDLRETLDQRIASAANEARRTRRLARMAYHRFASHHGFGSTPPSMLSIMRSQVELNLLGQQAEAFRNSPLTTLMEQNVVTRRYFTTIVPRIRSILQQAHDEARQWSESVMTPLADEIQEYRDTIARQIADLQATLVSRKTIQKRIDILRRDSARLRAQALALERVDKLLTRDVQGPPARAAGQN